MSVTGPAAQINAIKELSERELRQGITPEQSWHNSYTKSPYVFVGGVHNKLTEGDIVIVFSQFGDVIDVNMVRDNKTGESRGFVFVGYRDTRSCWIAIDNLNGFELAGKRLRVDHVLDYKATMEIDSGGNIVKM
eukprot:Trichotokara_eunicae@DN7140_c0_g1_i1.p1